MNLTNPQRATLKAAVITDQTANALFVDGNLTAYGHERAV